ncbi:MAG: hypothetical protein ABIN83_05390 [Sphingomicrobium sp.]
MLRKRALIVLPVALLLIVVAVRAMIFLSPAGHPLAALRPTFAGHPQSLIDGAMRDIGLSARTGGAMPPSARQTMMRANRAYPLAAEPFLIEGTAAQMAGNGARAEALFIAARRRDPRAPGPRYFLADLYLRSNRIAAGLDEMGALARLSEKASRPLGPALAAYARTPGAIPQLRHFFHDSPSNRDTTLEILAKNPANAPLVLALAPPLPLRQSPQPVWPAALVGSLVAAGDYVAAEDMWRRINGIGQHALLYDPQFRDRSAGPPFNWQLSSGSAGVAEPSGAGGLNVIYYGREEIAFATQLIRLSPGSYRLAMRLDGPASAGVAWTVACVGSSNRQLLSLSLTGATKGALSGSFTVPSADCPAQWIQLRGRPAESSETAQLTISGLKLDPVGGL